ncbi:MAG: hypothetical protein ACREJ3_04855 [Polyangiaceae bacterium]
MIALLIVMAITAWAAHLVPMWPFAVAPAAVFVRAGAAVVRWSEGMLAR